MPVLIHKTRLVNVFSKCHTRCFYDVFLHSFFISQRKAYVEWHEKRHYKMTAVPEALHFLVFLGATKPKTIERRLLHPWIRRCVCKDLNESVGETKSNLDRYRVKFSISVKLDQFYLEVQKFRVIQSEINFTICKFTH